MIPRAPRWPFLAMLPGLLAAPWARAQAPTPPARPQQAPESATAHEHTWIADLKYEAFVDAYASVNYGLPKPQSPTVPLGFIGGNQLRAYDVTNGFALHWVGIDVTHAPDPVGGGVNLRFGPGAVLFNAPGLPDSVPSSGLQYVKNAFVSFRPGGRNGRVTLTLGKYNQPFGSEVPESQYDINYTRSLLYWYAQPLFLTGFRADVAITGEVTGSVFLVNGWNTSQDTNLGKTAAIQFSWTPMSEITALAGYSIGPEQTDTAPKCAAGTSFDPMTGTCTATASSANLPANGPLEAVDGANGRLRHFVDLVIDAKPTRQFRALLNADYGTESLPPGASASRAHWYGVNLALKLLLDDDWFAALRTEYYADPQGFTTLTSRNTKVGDITFTVGYCPNPHVFFKLDNRIDIANEAFFQKGVSDTSSTQLTTTLGVVATTGL